MNAARIAALAMVTSCASVEVAEVPPPDDECFCSCPDGVPLPPGTQDDAFCQRPENKPAEGEERGAECCIWHGSTVLLIGRCSAAGVCVYSEVE